MKKFLSAAFMIGAMFAICACSGSDDGGTPAPNPGPTPNPYGTGITDGTAVNPASMKMSALSGFVYDKAGNALSGVTVTSGTESVVTDPDGGFVLSKVNSVKGRSVVNFSLAGYVDVVRSAQSVDGDVWEVVMVSEYEEGVTASSYKSASDAVTLTAGGMTVDIGADGFKDAETSAALGSSDWAQAKMFYLSPDKEDFAAMMPGSDLAAIRTDGSEAQLISYGMTKVDLTSSAGKKLQLADGKPATLTFPVPEKFKDDTPATIPLWSFDEATGLWKEEGVATYDAASNTYIGTVTHFSWVNLDYPEARATLKVIVKDAAGNVVPNTKVDVDGQRDFFTNVKGEADGYVPINTDFYVTIHSEDYANYTPEVKQEVSAIATAGETKTVEITLPTLAHISGKVVNAGKGNALATLWIEYAGKSTKKVHNDAEGQFFMNAPANYTGAGVLKMRAADGSVQSYDITLDGKDHAYTLTIKTDATTGGSITFTPEGGTAHTIIVDPIYYEDMLGASLIDNTLSFDGGACTVAIEGYSESQTTYNNVRISLSADGIYPFTENGKATVTMNEYGNVRFQISGNVEYQDWSAGREGAMTKASISGDFTVPMLGKGKILTKIASKSAEFPSFTPWINGKSATIGLQVTESAKFGKGILMWLYDETLDYSDYAALRDQAKASLGEPVSEFDGGDGSEGWADMSVAYFYNAGKYVMVSYCPWREGGDDWILEEMKMGHNMMGSISNVLQETHNGRIQIYALEGMTIDYKAFVHEMGR